MASIIDICNLSLANLGDEATISSIDPPDGSTQAAHCSRFYPIAKDQLLEMHGWSFATVRTELALLDGAPDQWEYMYAYPGNCIKILKVLGPEAHDDDDTEDFEVESLVDGTKVILSNTEFAWVRYVHKVEDPSKFTPGFVVSLAWLLTSYLTGPITKDISKKEAAYKTFLLELKEAKLNDSQVGRRDRRKTYEPTSVAAR